MDSDSICCMIVKPNEKPFANISELTSSIEKGSEKAQIKAIDNTLRLILAGEQMSKLTIPIIRFVAPTKNKLLKKYLLLYYEICKKTHPDGKMRQEIVLLCNNLLNDLSHPNEYIRGGTLRFLTKVTEKEILEPLVPSILSCLDHRHSYVRKNAIQVVHHICLRSPALIPDAVEIVHNRLADEVNDSCKRNCILMLLDISPELAIKYIHSISDRFASLDETLQCTIAESLKRFKDKRFPEKPLLVEYLKRLMLSSYDSVKYESASSLVVLAPDSAVVAKLVITCYVDLLKKETDNSAKLAILSNIERVLRTDPSVLGDSLMNIFGIDDSADIDISEKIVKLVLHSTTSSNVESVVNTFGKELTKPSIRTVDEEIKYKSITIGAIVSCALKFNNMKTEAIQLLIETMHFTSLGDYINLPAYIHKIVSSSPEIQITAAKLLISNLQPHNRILVVIESMWMIGEYATDPEGPGSPTYKRREGSKMPQKTSTKFLDRNYAGDSNAMSLSIQKLKTLSATFLYKGHELDSRHAAGETGDSSTTGIVEPNALGYINDNKWCAMAGIASTLVKMYIRYKNSRPQPPELNMVRAKTILATTKLMKKLKEYPGYIADRYTYDRLVDVIKYMAMDSADQRAMEIMENSFLNDIKYVPDTEVCCDVLESSDAANKAHTPLSQLSFRLLKTSMPSGADERYDEDLNEALGVGKYAWVKHTPMSNGRILSLTGLSDPVYVEANISINGFNCMLDIFVFNQTSITLQNVTLEFTSHGNLIEIARVPDFSLRPQGFHCIKVTAKVTSINLGIIIGTVMYSTSMSTDVSIVNLDKIFINMAEFIRPASCTLVEFQRMWYDFEWENKVNIETDIRDLREYLKSFIEATRMKSLSNENNTAYEYGFLSANLYAKSIFGEDSLVNISADKDENGRIKGSVRIRSQIQGVAISFGDIISAFHGASKIAVGGS